MKKFTKVVIATLSLSILVSVGVKYYEHVKLEKEIQQLMTDVWED